MEISNLSNVDNKETRALRALLDVFGTACSLEDIAAAYSKSNGDVDRAGEILFELQGAASATVPDGNDPVAYVAAHEDLAQINRDVNSQKLLPPSNHLHQRTSKTKSQNSSASVGSVSSILGNSYLKPFSSSSGPSRRDKPLRLEVPKSVLDASLNPSTSEFEPRKDTISNKDVEAFLLSMLGEGFKLNMDVIREVLDSCGYDIEESMKKLLDVSSKVVESGVPSEGYADMAKSSSNYMGVNKMISSERCLQSSCSIRESEEAIDLRKQRANLSQELVKSIFAVPEREDESNRRNLCLARVGARAVHESLVKEPLKDTPCLNEFPKRVTLSDEVVDKDEEYKKMRSDAKQHWSAMKQYYEEAVVAFMQGERERANYLLQEGKRYCLMARQADDKAVRQIVDGTKESETKKDMKLDISDFTATDAIKMLKSHLLNLANIRSFGHLVVIIGPDDTGPKNVQKRRKLRKVLSFLEMHSIKWRNHESDPNSVVIQLSDIDRNKLVSSVSSGVGAA